MKTKIWLAAISILPLLYSCELLAPQSHDSTHTNFTPEITVLPGTTVQAGQEIFLSAYPPTSRDLYVPNKIYWIFGDEEEEYRDFKEDDWINNMGISVSHFYMKPGQYKVRVLTSDQMPLSIGPRDWDPDYDPTVDVLAQNEIIITVEGEPYNGLFELLMADMNSRISQTVYVRLLDESISGAYVEVEIKSDNGYARRLLRSGIRNGDLLSFDLENWSLPEGQYRLEAKLYSSPSNCLDTITEYYNKSFPGYPAVGIDKNNNVCIKGVPTYPVSATLITAYYGEFERWSQYVNSTMGEGYVDYFGDNSGRVEDHQPVTFANYLDRAQAAGLTVQGPRVWEGAGERPNARNSNPFMIREYAELCRDKPALLGWVWIDEPNMGASRYLIPPQTNRAWYFLSHYYDQQHPVIINLFCIPYLPRNRGSSYWEGMKHRFDYIGSETVFNGRKTFIADIISFDYYPIDDYGRANSPEGTPVISNYLETLETVQDGTFHLAPVFTCIEITDVFGEDSVAGHPTPEQLKMLSWASIIHNAKGLNWFPYFARPLEENFAMLAEIKDQITELTAPILAGDITDRVSRVETDLAGVRIDIKMTETGDAYWLFAARITEPYEMEDAGTDVHFTLNRHFGEISVEGENRTITANGFTFTDRFEPCDVHIYRLEK